jgi:hypothetical protein
MVELERFKPSFIEYRVSFLRLNVRDGNDLRRGIFHGDDCLVLHRFPKRNTNLSHCFGLQS